MRPSTLWKIRGIEQWALISKGKTFRSDPVWIKWCAPENHVDEPTRLGFAISKKYGNAVVRNKFKRRVREIVRKNATNVDDLRGVFLLVGVTRSTKELVTYNEIENAFSALISSLK